MTIRPAFWPLPRDVYVIVARLYFVSGLTNTINIYSHTATLLCCLQQGGDKGNVVISQRIKNNLHTTVITKIWIQRRKPTRGGSVWTQVQQIFFNTSSTTDVLTTCGFSGFGSI